MKRLFFLVPLLPLFLTSCNGAHVARFGLAIDTEGMERQEELVAAAERVVDRVVTSMGKKATNLKTATVGDTPVLEVTLPDDASVKTLTDIVTSGFTFRVMEETSAETADMLIEGGETGFRETGLTEEDLHWVEVSTPEGSETAQVRLNFTQPGKDLLTSVFAQNVGKRLGLFVRERLVSVMAVESSTPDEEILITGIPSATVAEVFADDTNVGLHVQFVPLD